MTYHDEEFIRSNWHGEECSESTSAPRRGDEGGAKPEFFQNVEVAGVTVKMPRGSFGGSTTRIARGAGQSYR